MVEHPDGSDRGGAGVVAGEEEGVSPSSSESGAVKSADEADKHHASGGQQKGSGFRSRRRPVYVDDELVAAIKRESVEVHTKFIRGDAQVSGDEAGECRGAVNGCTGECKIRGQVEDNAVKRETRTECR